MNKRRRVRAPSARDREPRIFRPLDPLRSIKVKLGVLVATTVTVAVLMTLLGIQNQLDPTSTLVLAVAGGLVVTQILARGMTSPLREMTAAARAMADGDYSIRVTATSRDEVGQLAEAFNVMSEDLESIDILRREVIANVSHELRTPIAALQAQLENLVDGVTEADPETMRTALAQTERLGRLVTYFMDLSRIEAGDVDLDIGPLNIKEFLSEVVEAAALVATSAGKDVHWIVNVTPDSLQVQADAERLHQVFANLFHNAYRHSPSGGTVQVSARKVKNNVVLEVADEGPGIPEAERERVFGRFERGTSSQRPGSPSTGGTGLGLAISRWAVGLHDGTIEVVASQRGATMRVTLPLNGPVERTPSDYTDDIY